MTMTALSPQAKARLAGFCYLVTIGVGAFDHLFVAGRLIVPGDAAATAQNLVASASLYRVAFALDMIPAYAVVTVLFYDLFKPVDRSLSLLAAVFSLLGGAVGSAIGVLQLAPVVALRDIPTMSGLAVDQQLTLVSLFLELHHVGFTISLAFFGFYCAVLGWLIMTSGLMPRIVGGLMAVAGVAWVTYAFAAFVAPPAAAGLGPWALGVGTLGEGALTLWLLSFGVNARSRRPARTE